MSPQTAPFSTRRTFAWIGAGLLLVVGIPFVLSWGPGIDGRWHGISVHHHGIRNCWLAFFLLLLSGYGLSTAFREGCLGAVSAYNALELGVHRSVERWVLALLAVWLGTLKWLQCANLSTENFDHGLFLNVLWNIAHGNGPWCSILGRHFFSEHFALILYPLAIPYRFANWYSWPLLMQTAAMIGAVAVVVGLGWKVHPLRPVERLMLALLIPMTSGFQHVHATDVHPIAFGILAVVALYALARHGRWGWFYLLLPVALFGIQEDVSLMVAGLALVLLVDPRTRTQGVIVMVFSAAALWVNVEGVLRHFTGGASGFMMRYKTMGGNIEEIALKLLLQPGVPLGLFLSWSHLAPLLNVFAGFGFLPFGALSTVIGLLPPILQHSLADYAPQYQYGYHYPSNILPFLMLSTLACLSARRFPLRWIVPGFLAAMAYANLRVPQYVKPKDPAMVRRVWEVARLLPPEAAVSVQNNIGVPFCLRKNVLQYPRQFPADVIVLAPSQGTRPLSREDYDTALAALQKDARWTGQEKDGVWVFRKRLRSYSGRR